MNLVIAESLTKIIIDIFRYFCKKKKKKSSENKLIIITTPQDFFFSCFYSLADKDETAAINAIATIITETTSELWRDVISLALLSTGVERYERGGGRGAQLKIKSVHLPAQLWLPPGKSVLRADWCGDSWKGWLASLAGVGGGTF